MLRYIKRECHSLACEGIERTFQRRYNIGDLVVFGCMHCAERPSPADLDDDEPGGRVNFAGMARIGFVALHQAQVNQLEAEMDKPSAVRVQVTIVTNRDGMPSVSQIQHYQYPSGDADDAIAALKDAGFTSGVDIDAGPASMR